VYNGGPHKLRNADGLFLDVTVVRDDSSGASAVPFAALLETQKTRQPENCPTGDSLPGVRVARCRAYPNDSIQVFGYQRRVQVELSIATDPNDPAGNRLYVAWCDSLGPLHLRANLAASADGGLTWQQLMTVPNATNPSLAVDSTGRLGFLFQQLSTGSSGARWITRLLVSSDRMLHARSYTLADTPALRSLVRIQPYIGDWIELHARGKEFLGVFSAANRPDSANFPNGVTYQRVVRYQRQMLVRRTPLLGQSQDLEVAPSIDPYFFRVGPREAPECAALRLRVQGQPPASVSAAAVPSAIADTTVRRMRQIGCDLSP